MTAAASSGYRVVVNDDGQYSIWAQEAELPRGWTEAGRRGSREECLDQVERIWNGPRLCDRGDAPDARGPSVHQLVEEQASRCSRSVAVVAGRKQMTYSELERQANQLANNLLRRGIGRGTSVALLAERGIELVVAVLAILKAGAAYVPLDPEYPAARLGFMLSDATPAAILTRQSIAERLCTTLAGSTLVLDLDDPAIRGESEEPPRCPTDAGDIAYVIYTSGSTGQPKGVAMPHASLVNLLRWQALDSTAGKGTGTLQFASIGFDVSFQEIFSTWSTGGTLVMVTEEERRDLRALWRLIVACGVQRLFLPPAVLTQLARVGSGLSGPAPLLEEVITAGEALKIDGEMRTFFATVARCRLINQYGPTEAHVVTAHHLPSDPDRWPSLPPIGTPIGGVQGYVLDEDLRRVAVGDPGELYLGGAGVGAGYLNRPRQTAERFVPDPFASRHGARLYRTGDLVRLLPDGTFAFQGRTDRQVKLRGFRVELEEIEKALSEHPGVREAAAILRHDLAAGPQLVAYVTTSSEEIPGDVVTAWLMQRLPSFMVPTVVVGLRSMPRTRNGKVDYEGLARVSTPARISDAPESVAPRSPVETALVTCFSDLLGLPTVGVHDNFFALGGHSLLATQLASRIEESFHVKLSLRQLFDHPTVAGLAQVISDGAGRTATPPSGQCLPRDSL